MKIVLWWDKKHKSVKFKLLEDVKVGEYTLLKGVQSDGASVPSIFWWFCQAIDPRYAAVFAAHDFLYAHHLTTRKEADIFMRDELINAGMCPFKAFIIFICVRLFGKSHWDVNK